MWRALPAQWFSHYDISITGFVLNRSSMPRNNFLNLTAYFTSSSVKYLLDPAAAWFLIVLADEKVEQRLFNFKNDILNPYFEGSGGSKNSLKRIPEYRSIIWPSFFQTEEIFNNTNQGPHPRSPPWKAHECHVSEEFTVALKSTSSKQGVSGPQKLMSDSSFVEKLVHLKYRVSV